ncbi:MAG: hypothetical protein AAF577_03080 [Pseudomonadota bacterium]
MIQAQKPPVPNFEQAMDLLTHAEDEIRRGEMQARTFMVMNAALSLTAWSNEQAMLALLLALLSVGAVALGVWTMLFTGGGGKQMKDARQALYLDAIGEKDSYQEFLRTFTLMAASPGERVLHAVYLRSTWAKRKMRMVRILGGISLFNLALAGFVIMQRFF